MPIVNDLSILFLRLLKLGLKLTEINIIRAEIITNKRIAMKKLAVITGGSQGIGKALIYQLARQGLSIATCARHADPLEALSRDV